MKSAVALALLTALLGCITDLRSRRIPNALTLGSALGALVFHGVTANLKGLAFASEGWLLPVAVFFLPFALGGLGAGDLKLLGALGAWLGPAHALWLVLYTGVAGGALALLVALARGYLPLAARNIWLLLTHWSAVGLRPLHEVSLEGSSGPRLAYAIPIFVGAVVTIWLH